MKSKSKKDLEKENEALKQIIKDTLWMARRYAHGRSSYAPTSVNEAIDQLKALGINIPDDTVDGITTYADDGMFGHWDSKLKNFIKKSETKI